MRGQHNKQCYGESANKIDESAGERQRDSILNLILMQLSYSTVTDYAVIVPIFSKKDFFEYLLISDLNSSLNFMKILSERFFFGT